LVNVDLPTFGRPTRQANPERKADSSFTPRLLRKVQTE
jgi:hypothetical protein